MILTLDLSPQVEQGYLAAAQARGLPLAEFVREVLVASQPLEQVASLSPEEWVREFRAWSQSHAADDLPILSDDAMSRDFIYEGRGL